MESGFWGAWSRGYKWDFPKIRVPYFGVLIIRTLLFRVLLLAYFGTPKYTSVLIRVTLRVTMRVSIGDTRIARRVAIWDRLS